MGLKNSLLFLFLPLFSGIARAGENCGNLPSQLSSDCGGWEAASAFCSEYLKEVTDSKTITVPRSTVTICPRVPAKTTTYTILKTHSDTITASTIFKTITAHKTSTTTLAATVIASVTKTSTIIYKPTFTSTTLAYSITTTIYTTTSTTSTTTSTSTSLVVSVSTTTVTETDQTTTTLLTTSTYLTTTTSTGTLYVPSTASTTITTTSFIVPAPPPPDSGQKKRNAVDKSYFPPKLLPWLESDIECACKCILPSLHVKTITRTTSRGFITTTEQPSAAKTVTITATKTTTLKTTIKLTLTKTYTQTALSMISQKSTTTKTATLTTTSTSTMTKIATESTTLTSVSIVTATIVNTVTTTTSYFQTSTSTSTSSTTLTSTSISTSTLPITSTVIASTTVTTAATTTTILATITITPCQEANYNRYGDLVYISDLYIEQSTFYNTKDECCQYCYSISNCVFYQYDPSNEQCSFTTTAPGNLGVTADPATMPLQASECTLGMQQIDISNPGNSPLGLTIELALCAIQTYNTFTETTN